MGGREHKEACTWIAPDSACVFFPYYPAVYPYCVVVINLSHMYNNMMSPVSLSSKSMNTEVILGTPNTVVAMMTLDCGALLGDIPLAPDLLCSTFWFSCSLQ